MSDTEARDRLANLIEWAETDTYATSQPDGMARTTILATAILAAGFRPPARTVSTVEELDALAAHTVVRYCARYGWRTAERTVRDRWWPAGEMAYITNTQVLRYEPATVLYEPTEGE